MVVIGSKEVLWFKGLMMIRGIVFPLDMRTKIINLVGLVFREQALPTIVVGIIIVVRLVVLVIPVGQKMVVVVHIRLVIVQVVLVKEIVRRTIVGEEVSDKLLAEHLFLI